jgi:hypothetical protein
MTTGTDLQKICDPIKCRSLAEVIAITAPEILARGEFVTIKVWRDEDGTFKIINIEGGGTELAYEIVL